jgi:hypothetical protein
MNKETLARIRLHTQHLVGAPLGSATDVVGWFGAVQSQEAAVAPWSLGQRSRATQGDVADALASGAILRTHILRPTWHYVLPADLRWMMMLTGPRVMARSRSMDRKIGADKLVARSNDAIARALEGGNALTRAELGEALARRRIQAKGQLLGHLVMHAELALVACSGPPRGKQQTYALVDERVPDRTVGPTGEEAITELARRYVRAHGPATPRDFSWWSGLTIKEARRGMEAAGLETMTVEDRTYWFEAPLPAPRKGAVRAHLLQAYDELGIAFTESRNVLDSGRHARPRPTGAVSFLHWFTIDGQVAGYWRRALGRGPGEIDVAEARPLGAREWKAIDAEVARYGKFLGVASSYRKESLPK